METLFVKNKDGGEGRLGLINFPPLKRGRLFERGAQKRIYGNLILVCKTLKKKSRAFRNISKKYIYISDWKVSPRASFVKCYLYLGGHLNIFHESSKAVKGLPQLGFIGLLTARF